MSTEPFTRDEETEILRFLGYPDWETLGQSIQLGFPAASQPLFLVRDSFQRMAPTARPRIRQDLCELRSIESQMSQARSRLRATSLNGLKINPRELHQLRGEFTFWRRRLADDLGVVPNPYSQIEYAGMGGGINAKVHG